MFRFSRQGRARWCWSNQESIGSAIDASTIFMSFSVHLHGNANICQVFCTLCSEKSWLGGGRWRVHANGETVPLSHNTAHHDLSTSQLFLFFQKTEHWNWTLPVQCRLQAPAVPLSVRSPYVSHTAYGLRERLLSPKASFPVRWFSVLRKLTYWPGWNNRNPALNPADSGTEKGSFGPNFLCQFSVREFTVWTWNQSLWGGLFCGYVLKQRALHFLNRICGKRCGKQRKMGRNPSGDSGFDRLHNWWTSYVSLFITTG